MYSPSALDASNDAVSMALAAAIIGVDMPTAIAQLETVVATLATAMASSTAVSSSIAAASPSSNSPDQAPGECSLLGPFALIVQAALGALALLALVYKRWRERPQRPLKIWFFDVSKQVFGSALVHIANIFMSMLTSGRLDLSADAAAAAAAASAAAVTTKLLTLRDEPYVPNPCSFYLLNLAIDVSPQSRDFFCCRSFLKTSVPLIK